MELLEQIKNYQPYNDEEDQDKKVFLKYVEEFADILTRKNVFAHVTSSSWIVNPDGTKILMIYHNIYDSWSWTGGHADGDANLLNVAVKEAKEETGIKDIKAIKEEIFSLELICVNGHWKKGKYVSPHIHLNTTFLLEADDTQELYTKPDENSGVRWVPVKDVVSISDEPWMKIIYQKLNNKLEEIKW